MEETVPCEDVLKLRGEEVELPTGEYYHVLGLLQSVLEYCCYLLSLFYVEFVEVNSNLYLETLAILRMA